jgi:predicted ATP-grasp superfamily ATP-dependent carboligase
MGDRYSVLLLDGESHFAVSVARCLASVPGITVHALSKTANCPLRFSRACRSFRTLGRGEAALSLSAISQALARTGASILLPIDLAGIRFASAHCEPLREMAALAPVPALKTLNLVENKWTLADLLAEHGVAHPRTLLTSGDEEFARSLDAFPFPVLLKPTMGSLGLGMRAFADRESLLDFTRDVRGSVGQSIVQAFLPGEDIDCSVLCHQGEILAHTIQRGFIPSRQPFAPPGGITFLEDVRVIDTVTELMRRIRWNGIAHLDLRYGSGGGGRS